MPITIKSSRMNYKDSNGDYVGVDAVSEKTTSEYIDDITEIGVSTLSSIETASETAIAEMEAKRVSARDSIPSDYTELSDEVSDLKSAFKADLIAGLKAVYEPVIEVIANGINDSNGKSKTDSKKARTQYIPVTVGFSYLFVLNSSDYNVVNAWLYTSSSESNASRKVDLFDDHTTLFTPSTGEKYLRASFEKTDGTDMVDADYTAINAAIKITTITDDQLTVSGIPADSKTVGDRIDSILSELNEVIEFPSVNLFDIRQLLKASGWSNSGDDYYGTVQNACSAFSQSSKGLEISGSYKQNTAYSFSCKYYTNSPATSGNSIRLSVEYTDGSTSNLIYFAASSSSEWSNKRAYTDAQKTVKKFFFTYSGLTSNVVHFKEMQIEEGETYTTYKPFMFTGIDSIARNTNEQIESVIGYKTTNVKLSLGGIDSASGATSDNAYAIHTEPLNDSVKRITIGNATARLIFYRDGEYIGKLNSHEVVDKVSGDWRIFSNTIIDVSSFLQSANADSFILVMLSESEISDEATARTFFDDNCVLYTIYDIEQIEADVDEVVTTITGHKENLFDNDWLLVPGWTLSNGEYVGNMFSLLNSYGAPLKFPFRDGVFEANTIYTFSITYYNEGAGSSSANEVYIRVKYTDGTEANLFSFRRESTTITQATAVTASDKTIDCIYLKSQSNTNLVWHIKDVCLYKGNLRKSGFHPTYIPYEMTAVDKIAREQLSMLGNLAIPTYYTNFETAVNNARMDIASAGHKGISFIFSTDQHWEWANMRTSPAMIREAVRKLDLPMIVLGGDIIDGGKGVTKSEAARRLSEAYAAYNLADTVLYVIGNHDGNDVGQTVDEYRLTYKEKYGILMKSLADKVVFSDIDTLTRLAYYYDIQYLKTRCIVLDTGLEGIALYPTQLNWFTATLEATPDDYKIIIFGHIWREHDELSLHGEAIIEIADDFNANSEGAEIVALIGGHNHRDYHSTTDEGINLIITDCDTRATHSDAGDAGMTVNDMCFDIITINYEIRTIDCRRVGRGSDRSYTF